MSNSPRQGFSKRRAVERVLRRLGLHASPLAVVDALAGEGILVSQVFVRSVKRELAKRTADLHRTRANRRVSPKKKLHRRKIPPRG